MASRLSRKAILASLFTTGSALVASGESRADIVVVNPNVNIGYTSGDVSSYSGSLPGNTQSFNIGRLGLTAGNGIGSGANSKQRLITFTSVKNVKVKTSAFPHFLKTLSAGKTFNNAGGNANLGGTIAAVNKSAAGSPSTYTDKYFAFSFTNSNTNQTDYGWIYGSLTDNSFGGLNYNLISYAYDTSGNPIATGQTSAVPEPSSMAFGALAALVTGAAGLRRWRNQRAGQIETAPAVS